MWLFFVFLNQPRDVLAFIYDHLYEVIPSIKLHANFAIQALWGEFKSIKPDIVYAVCEKYQKNTICKFLKSGHEF